MAMKYAGSEVLQMAVEIEIKGKQFYDSVVENVKDEKVRLVFKYLSDEEVKHEKLFRHMLAGVEAESDDSVYDSTEMTQYFRSLIDRKIFPTDSEGRAMKEDVEHVSAAIRIALSLEKDAVLFFHELMSAIQEKDHPVVQKIIDEERTHIKRILGLKAELGA